MSFSRQSRRTCQRRWHWLKKWNQTTRGTHSHRRLQGAKKIAQVGAGKNTHLTKQHKAQVHPAPRSTWGHARTHEGWPITVQVTKTIIGPGIPEYRHTLTSLSTIWPACSGRWVWACVKMKQECHRTNNCRQRDGNDKNFTQRLRFGHETVPIEDGGPDVIGRLLYPPYLWSLIRLHLQNNRCATSSKVPSKDHKLIHLKFHLIWQIR